MTRFIDEYLPDCIPGYPVYCSPRWSTEISMQDSGSEIANQRWSHPLHRYTLPEAVRNMTTLNALRDHWLIMAGPARVWPFRDPLDFASIPLSAPNTVPAISPQDQVLGVGDGYTQSFQLKKIYAVGSHQYERIISFPVVSSIRLYADGVGAGNSPEELLTGWSVDRTTGIVTFDVAPDDGRGLWWGGLFDVVVRYESDDVFDGIVRTFGVGGFADLTLLEVRSC